MNEKILYARPQIEFISYDGKYPTLCTAEPLLLKLLAKDIF